MTWEEFPADGRELFQAFRWEVGEELILDKNLFVEGVLPAATVRDLGSDLDVYRAPYPEAGERRRPMLDWPRQLPIEGEPADVVEIVRAYGQWLGSSPVPKLFVNAEPGSILVGAQREFCRTWSNQREVTGPARPRRVRFEPRTFIERPDTSGGDAPGGVTRRSTGLTVCR